jgi:anaerobic ribonucleoside-triphosphate reductase activating protein
MELVMSSVNLARVHYPVTVLGPGRRVGVWFQGCTIGCAGCMSQDTWDAAAGERIAVDDLCDLVLAARADEGLDGVTISGGEPFQQPEALLGLCSELRLRWPEADVLVYSGYPFRRLRDRHGAVLALVDAVIAEPFVAGRPTELPWRGSANQTLHVLSPSVEGRYAAAAARAEAGAGAPVARLQVTADERAVWVTGIPRRGDLDRMRAALVDKGLVLGEVSWRARG